MIKTKFKLFKEMSISDDRILNSENIFSNIKDYKTVSKYLIDKIIELKNKVLDIDKVKFTKIRQDNSLRYVKYPDNIIPLISDIENVISNSKNTEVYDKYFSIVYPDSNEYSFYIEIQIELNYLNRIHIPIGLPYILKGLGLGKKIYKSLISELGYISTSRLDRTLDAVFVWDSLRKDSDIFTFINGENVLCIDINKKYEEILLLLEKFYSILNDTILLDDDFKSKYKKFYKSELNYLLKHDYY